VTGIGGVGGGRDPASSLHAAAPDNPAMGEGRHVAVRRGRNSLPASRVPSYAGCSGWGRRLHSSICPPSAGKGSGGGRDVAQPGSAPEWGSGGRGWGAAPA